MSRDVITALDVLNAAKLAISFTQGMDSATFLPLIQRRSPPSCINC